MGERIEQIKKLLVSAFPNLKNDANFNITSKETSAYNCIAWAYGYDDRWMWPKTGKDQFLDGICYWPSDEIQEPTIENFVKAFRLKGYECCDNGDFEKDYQKIALYAKPDNWGICTHASRQKRNGCWTSKLGPYCDIQHGTPYSIENNDYGKVRCFMKRLFV
jgi:hypothetical protein